MAYCLRLLRYLGAPEGGMEHLQILKDYNTLANTEGGLPGVTRRWRVTTGAPSLPPARPTPWG